MTEVLSVCKAQKMLLINQYPVFEDGNAFPEDGNHHFLLVIILHGSTLLL